MIWRHFIPSLWTGIIALSFLSSSADATEPTESEPLYQPMQIKKPVTYSLGVMSVGLPLLIGTGAFERGPSLNNFQNAFESGPEWENDPVVFNYVLHPLWGSETYLRAREANWGMPKSIAFSMGMSVTWEYLMESWVTHPSAQDLIFTTGIGWMIGEMRYKMKQRTDDRWAWALDPIHTTLQHLHVGIRKDRDGELETVTSWTWRF